jgi:hypothetical protein
MLWEMPDDSLTSKSKTEKGNRAFRWYLEAFKKWMASIGRSSSMPPLVEARPDLD